MYNIQRLAGQSMTYVDNVMSYKPLKLLCLIFNVEKLVEKSIVLS